MIVLTAFSTVLPASFRVAPRSVRIAIRIPGPIRMAGLDILMGSGAASDQSSHTGTLLEGCLLRPIPGRERFPNWFL